MKDTILADFYTVPGMSTYDQTPARRLGLPLGAVVFIAVMACAGAAALVHGVLDWRTPDWPRTLAYGAIALLASGMKVSLPGITGTMSMYFLFMLIGLAELRLPETLAIGCAGTVVQSLFHSKVRPRLVQVVFNISCIVVGTQLAHAAFHAPLAIIGALESSSRLLLAAGVFFVFNTLSVAAVIGWTEGRAIIKLWRQSYFWSFPNYLMGAAVAWMVSSLSRFLGWQTALLILPVLYFIYRSHHLHVTRLDGARKRAEEQQAHAEEAAKLHRRTIETLALAIEAKDQTTHDHLERVEVYAIAIGKELGLTASELDALRAAALLHDVGKVAVPEHIIAKPGKLTPEEFEKMKVHTVVGAEIVQRIPFPYPVAPIVRSHHEKWNGNGYPDGLSGEQIPLGARILAAVDCLDALSSDRQYRRALPFAEAIAVIRSEAGVSYDPRVVEVMVRRSAELENLSRQSGSLEKATFSTELRIERGHAPAAGFESSGKQLTRLNESITQGNGQPSTASALIEYLDRCDSRTDALAVLPSALAQAIPHAAMVLYLLRGNSLQAALISGEEYRLFASSRIPLGAGLSGWVAENGKSICNGNPAVEPGFLNDPARFGSLHSALAAPLAGPTGVVGVLSLYSEQTDGFGEDDHHELLAIAKSLARVPDLLAGSDSPPSPGNTTQSGAERVFQRSK